MTCTPTPRRFRGAALRVVLAVGGLTVFVQGGAVAGQAVQIKTAVAGLEPFVCPVTPLPESPSVEEVRQADQLGSTARQAVILGDLERARGLLARAVSLHPGSPGLAYQYGRVLEDLGEDREAILQYCRALEFGAPEDDARDARSRVDAYAEATRRRVPPGALEAFGNGVTAVGEMRWDEALAAFTAASSAHSDFPESEYNRGVVLEALDRLGEAAEAFRAYLQLRPDAPDAIQVSERIGQLQVVPGSQPSSGSALALGILFPGGGQFYTGRPLGGVALLALAGGAAAAGLLIEETDVRCFPDPAPGQDCPPGDVIGRDTTRPYLTYGLAGAGALMLAGALEAFFHARGLDDVEMVAVGQTARILGPSVRARGLRTDVRFIRVTF